MSRWGARLLGAQLGLHGGYLLTQLGSVWVSWWPWNPFFAAVALLALLPQPLYWRRLPAPGRERHGRTALGSAAALLIAWGVYGHG